MTDKTIKGGLNLIKKKGEFEEISSFSKLLKRAKSTIELDDDFIKHTEKA